MPTISGRDSELAVDHLEHIDRAMILEGAQCVIIVPDLIPQLLTSVFYISSDETANQHGQGFIPLAAPRRKASIRFPAH